MRAINLQVENRWMSRTSDIEENRNSSGLPLESSSRFFANSLINFVFVHTAWRCLQLLYLFVYNLTKKLNVTMTRVCVCEPGSTMAEPLRIQWSVKVFKRLLQKNFYICTYHPCCTIRNFINTATINAVTIFMITSIKFETNLKMHTQYAT